LSQKRRAILSGRLNAFIPERLREFVTLAYSAPYRMAKPSSEQVLKLVETINEQARSQMAKPLFQLNHEVPSVKYLGLWARPKEATDV